MRIILGVDFGTAIGANVAGRRKAQVVEVDTHGLTWIKSSLSSSASNSCLEAALTGDRVVIRSSRDREGSRLSQPLPAWVDFVSRLV